MGSGDAGKRKRKNAIAGQFAARPIAMLESPAYRVLSRAAHQVLARLEIEHAHHGGKDNGRLPCTYQHFEEYGVHANMIGAALRELEALGFIVTSEKGAGGNADQRRASLYRITYRHAHGDAGDGTHNYRRINSVAEASAIQKNARDQINERAAANGKKAKSHPHFMRVKPPSLSEGETPPFPPSLSEGTCPPSLYEGTSISPSPSLHPTSTIVRRKPGRPKVAHALTPAERQRAFRARKRTASARPPTDEAPGNPADA